MPRERALQTPRTLHVPDVPSTRPNPWVSMTGLPVMPGPTRVHSRAPGLTRCVTGATRRAGVPDVPSVPDIHGKPGALGTPFVLMYPSYPHTRRTHVPCVPAYRVYPRTAHRLYPRTGCIRVPAHPAVPARPLRARP